MCTQVSGTCTLPSTLTFKYPSVEALVDYLSQELFSMETGRAGQPSDQRIDAEPASEDAVETSIAKELAELDKLLR